MPLVGETGRKFLSTGITSLPNTVKTKSEKRLIIICEILAVTVIILALTLLFLIQIRLFQTRISLLPEMMGGFYLKQPFSCRQKADVKKTRNKSV